MGLTEVGLSQAGWNQICAEVAEGSRLTALESRLVISEIMRLREHLVAKDLEWADLAMKQTGDVIAALGRAELAEEELEAAEQRAVGTKREADIAVAAEVRLSRECARLREELAAAEQRALEAVAGVAALRTEIEPIVAWVDAENVSIGVLYDRIEHARDSLAADDLGARWLAAADKQRRHLDYLALLVHRTHSADGTDYDGCTQADCRYSVGLRAEWRALKGV